MWCVQVAEAVLMGVPVVGTPIALEAMYFEDGESILFGRSANDFAAKIYALLTDDVLWQRIRKNAWEVLDEHFSVSKAREELEKIILNVIPGQSLYDSNPSC